MASLFLVGNINEYNFANAALAAHAHDLDIGGTGLTDVFVLHSPESEKHLTNSENWKCHLSLHGLHSEIFVSCMVNLQLAGNQQIERVARHVERFLLALDKRQDVYVDLTNGSSLYKSILSNIAYLLGVRRQFILNTPSRKEFLTPTELRNAYVALPEPALLDSVAPAWLTEVRRFNVDAREAARTLVNICGANAAERSGFEGDIQNAVQSWFRGVKNADGAALGGAVRHVGRAFEDLIRGVYESLSIGSVRPKNLNDMIQQICSHLNKVCPDYEPQLLEEVSQLLRRLRNASTHEQTSPEFGRIRARLSTELLLATSEYFRILNMEGLIKPSITTGMTNKCNLVGRPGTQYFFGLDGDDTGRELERLFQGGFDEESFSRFSTAVDSAIRAVSKQIKLTPISGEILFSSGDDILFKGNYSADAIEDLRATYNRIARGHTCSVGFGRTPKEAYIALKMAKATPGKDSVMGVELISNEDGLP
jgi:hypothetical protein